MVEKRICALVFIHNLVLLAFAIYFVLMFKANSIDTSSLKQIADDWGQHPYIDLYVVFGNNNCSTGDEYVFSRWWPGTIDGCDCRYSAYYGFTIYSASCDYNQTYSGCTGISSISPMSITMLGNFSICGKRGNSFKVDSKTGLCDKYTILCNPNAKSNDHKFCSFGESRCPINYFQMTTQKDSSPSYTYRAISNNLYIKFGYQEDSLPITSFLLEEGSPCMIRSNHSQNPKKVYHILENEMSSGCQYDELSERYTDPRYTAINQYSTNEYDLFQNNNILDKLMTLPNYDGYQNFKKTYNYSLFARPQINWNLSCEQNGIGSYEASRIFSSDFATILYSQLLVVAGSVFAIIVLTSITFSMLLICCKNELGFKMLFVALIISVLSFLFANTTKEAKTSIEFIISTQQVNGCSDEYTNLIIEKLADKLQDAYKYLEMGQWLYIAILSLVNIESWALLIMPCIIEECFENNDNFEEIDNFEDIDLRRSQNITQRNPQD